MKTRHFAAALLLLAAARGPAAAQKYAAVIQPVTPLSTFCAGRMATVDVRLGNNGVGAPAVWTTDIYHLRYHWKQGGVVVVYDGLKTALPNSVPAGGHTTVSAAVQAPAAPGTYDLVFDMAADGVGWFEWFGSKTWSQTVVVQPAAVCMMGTTTQAFASAFIPKIDGCFPGTETGGFVVCWGQNFGATKGTGKILMKGLPIGDLDLSSQPNLQWSDGAFYAQVSPDLTGFQKQKVRIQVVTSGHGATNEFPIDIKPALDIQQFPGTFGVSSTESGCFCLVSPGEFGAAHAGNFFGDHGTDTWTGPPLVNGWVYHSMHVDVVDGGFSTPGFAGGSDPGLGDVPTVTIPVNWAYDNGFTASNYNVTVFAIGPRGLPMQ